VTATKGMDRAAAVRAALLELVADQGLHGTSMGQVARRADVAIGTIYVHYADRDSLILRVFADVKRDLALSARTGWTDLHSPEERFLAAWHRVYAHLVERPERARFLLQLEASPYAKALHDAYDDDAAIWTSMTDDLGDALVELPVDLLYALALGPAVRMAATADAALATASTLDKVARGCWRAITR
jgi:AcrR family transcriptional regulator